MKCIIVEDEPLSADVLSKYISECPGLELTAVCGDALSASGMLRKTDPDLLFLDINLPGISGLTFLRSLSHPPMVIFTTAYPEFAIEGFESDAVDYLLKPFSFERFLKAVNKAYERSALLKPRLAGTEGPGNSSEFILLRSDKRIHRVGLDEIMYLESAGDYIKVFVHEKCIVVHETFRHMMDQLPQDRFIRIHKSFIVPVRRIKYLEGNRIRIEETMLPVGLVYRDGLMKCLGR